MHDALALFRGELSGLDDTGDLQLATMLGYAGEELTGVHRVQPFGFSAVPPVGAHGIALALRHQRELAAFLGVEHAQYRKRNQNPGEATLYDQWGNAISLTQSVKTIQHTAKIVIKVGTGSSPMIVAITPGRIDLGSDPAPYAVVTTNGPSTKVFSV